MGQTCKLRIICGLYSNYSS
uniref:Uncharacterized protein n=1 Tax=Arundo donax TaxID=35708 RepID=A0A0A9BQ00_ARUDO